MSPLLDVGIVNGESYNKSNTERSSLVLDDSVVLCSVKQPNWGKSKNGSNSNTYYSD